MRNRGSYTRTQNARSVLTGIHRHIEDFAQHPHELDNSRLTLYYTKILTLSLVRGYCGGTRQAKYHHSTLTSVGRRQRSGWRLRLRTFGTRVRIPATGVRFYSHAPKNGGKISSNPAATSTAPSDNYSGPDPATTTITHSRPPQHWWPRRDRQQ